MTLPATALKRLHTVRSCTAKTSGWITSSRTKSITAYEANWKYVLTIPAGMMSIFLLLMLVPDIGLRQHWYSEERALHSARPLSEILAEHGDEQHDGDQTKAEAGHD
jgi:hypothetical protein